MAPKTSRASAPQRGGRNPRGAVHVGQQHPELVEEAPGPRLARLERADDRVPGALLVSGRVLAWRAVAAADMPAFEADPQVQPGAALREALLAAVDGFRQLGDVYVVEMRAGGHGLVPRQVRVNG